MRTYNQLAFFQNRFNRKVLLNFLKLVQDYFDNVKYVDYSSREPTLNQTSRVAREQICRELVKTEKIVLSAMVNPVFYYSPPPAYGGYQGNVNILNNILQLEQFSIGKVQVEDIINKAIGVFDEDYTKSVFRTFNPFFWISYLIDIFVEWFGGILAKVAIDLRLSNQPRESFFVNLMMLLFRCFAWVIAVGSGVASICAWAGIQWSDVKAFFV